MNLKPSDHLNVTELHHFKNALMQATVVALTDQKGVIIYANDDFCRISKYSRDELIGQTHKIINSGYHSREFFTDLWRTIGTGNTWKGEIKNKAKDGSLYWMDTTIIPFMGANGKPYQYLSIRKEITHGKLTEQLLGQSEEKYHALFNYSPIPMWIYDVDTYAFLDINESAIRQYGYTKEEFLSMTIKDIRPKEDVPILEEALLKIKQADSGYHKGIYRHMRKNGTVMQVRIESNIVFLNGKKAEIILAIDITSELAAQVSLETANIRLANAQQIANLGYWSRNLKTGMVHWSDETYKIFEVERSAPLSFAFTVSMFHPEDRHLLEIDRNITPTNNFATIEHRIITASGKIKWVSERMRFIYDKDDVLESIEGVCMDITQQKLDEESIKRKKQLIGATNTFITCLLEVENWTDAISQSFDVIGKTVNVDRVYYFENHPHPTNDEMCCSQKIEWANDGTVPKIDNPLFQNVPFSIFDTFIDVLSAGKAFTTIVSSLPEGHIKTSLQAQHIKSALVLPVSVLGKFHGFMGFDDCKTERIWQDDEVAFLQTLTGNLETTIRKRKAETEVTESKQQFESVINNLPGITYRSKADKQCNIHFVSKELERTLGYTTSDFLSHKLCFKSIIHPDDLHLTHWGDCSEVLKLNISTSYRMICADGSIKHVREFARTICNEQGKPIWLDGVILDITEITQKDALLEQSNERFNLVMKATQEAIVDWDIVNDETIWGDGFHAMFGYDLTEYKNDLWSSNIHPDDKDRVLSHLQETVNNPGKLHFEADFKFVKADKSISYVKHRGIFLRNSEGVAVRAVGSMIDLTDAVLRTRKIEQQNETLREIAWTQSHVVRAPLASLMGLVDLMKMKSELELDETELLEKITDAGNELDKVIHTIVRKSEHLIADNSVY